MRCNRSFLRKVANNPNEVFATKRFDYIAKIKDNLVYIFRRDYEGKPWKWIVKIPVDKIESNEFKDWTYSEEYRTQRFKADPKHGNRYFTV